VNKLKISLTRNYQTGFQGFCRLIKLKNCPVTQKCNRAFSEFYGIAQMCNAIKFHFDGIAKMCFMAFLKFYPPAKMCFVAFIKFCHAANMCMNRFRHFSVVMVTNPCGNKKNIPNSQQPTSLIKSVNYITFCHNCVIHNSSGSINFAFD
jgi:hypothetical protein